MNKISEMYQKTGLTGIMNKGINIEKLDRTYL